VIIPVPIFGLFISDNSIVFSAGLVLILGVQDHVKARLTGFVIDQFVVGNFF
jgi:hypothetical protein